jgi:hypothetical protein
MATSGQDPMSADSPHPRLLHIQPFEDDDVGSMKITSTR